MAKLVTEGIGEFYQHYPRLTVIVTARARGTNNAMAAAWHTPISTKPPLFAVSIAAKRFTYELISESKEFAINFVPYRKVRLIVSVGASTGREIDKFKEFNIATEKPVKIAAPILKDSYAAYECKLVDNRECGDHNLLVGEIIATHWEEKMSTGDEVLDLDKVSPALYLGHDFYLTASNDKLKHIDRQIYGKGKK
jgi:flavin reductase (DIM6/NTAB) family NADH-FMN oxidoreductase RutF